MTQDHPLYKIYAIYANDFDLAKTKKETISIVKAYLAIFLMYQFKHVLNKKVLKRIVSVIPTIYVLV